MSRIRIGQLVLSLVVIASMAFPLGVPETAGARPAAQGGDDLKREYSEETGRVTFLSTASGRPLAAARALNVASGARVPDPARALADRYGPEFGLKNPAEELSALREDRSDGGRVTVRYQQTYRGVPVMGGELIVNTDEAGDLFSMNGEISPDLSVSTQPGIPADEARRSALQAMARAHEMRADELVATDPALWIYDPRLLGPDSFPAVLVWRMEVRAVDGALPINELVLVDAQRGGLALHFNQIDTAWSGTSVQQPALQDGPTPTPTATEIPPQEPEVTPEPPADDFRPTPMAPQPPAALEPGDPSAGPGPFYVNISGGNNGWDCTTPAQPCRNIQEAINKASAGAVIYVAGGTYTKSVNPNPNVLQISVDLTISGGWDSTFTNQNGASIIDGQNVNNGILILVGAVSVDGFIVQNSRSSNSGAIYIVSGSLTLTDSTLRGNTATNSGAGIFVFDGTVNLTNTTISGNTAGAGGGVYVNSGSVTLQNSTIAYNHASNGGGGLRRMGGTLALRNTIIAHNAAGTVGPDCNGQVSSSGYNILGNDAGCTITAAAGDQFDVDPLIASSLAGMRQVHALQAASPAIDTGTATGCPATDQRGIARPQGAGCDIGAYEYGTAGQPYAVAAYAGSPQYAQISTTFSELLLAVVTDADGLPVSGASVTFTAPASGASGTFVDTDTQVTTSTTDENGIAVASAFTANAVPGSYAVEATVAAVPGAASFQLTNSQVRYVSLAGADSGDCSNPAAACQTINYAITNSAAWDTILLTEGAYTGTGSQVILLNKSVTLSGGWNGVYAEQTGFSTIDGQNARRVLDLTGSTTSTIDRLIIRNGHSTSGGAGILISSAGNLTITNSTITANSTPSDGGGVKVNGSLALYNSTVSFNEADAGGGIYVFQSESATLDVKNSTIVYNEAEFGGGIYAATFWIGPIYVENTIIANNNATRMPSEADGDDCGAATIAVSNSNVIEKSTCVLPAGTGNHYGTDALVSVQPVGQAAYHIPQPGSPALGGGSVSTCTTLDQRGVNRLAGDGLCDIGAYEHASPGTAASFGLASDNPVSVGLSLSTTLAAYVVDAQGSPVSDVEVTFVGPGSGPGGVFQASGTTTVVLNTDSSGLAIAPFTANPQPGTYPVTLTAAGLPGSIDFSVTNNGRFISPLGADAGSCTNPLAPCQTIAFTIGVASAGDTILLAAGTYTGTGSASNGVANVIKDLNLLGGWDSSFSAQTGISTIDGENSRRGVQVAGAAQLDVLVDRFLIKNAAPAVLAAGNVTIMNSTITDNDTGIEVETYQTVALQNTTVSGNENRGIDAYCNNCLIEVNNSSIVFNTGTVGAGIWASPVSPSSPAPVVLIRNSIISGNTNTMPAYLTSRLDCNSVQLLDHSIVGNSTGCTIDSSVESQLDVSPRLYEQPSGAQQYFALLPTSPAIDSGDGDTCLPTDVRGLSRPQGAACDMGAYEYPAVTGSPASLVVLAGSDQQTNIESAFPDPLLVALRDSAGDFVSQEGAQVMFTAPGSGASLAFLDTGTNSSTANTDSYGMAVSSIMIATSEVGVFDVIASSAGVPSADIALENRGWFVSPTGEIGSDIMCTTPAVTCVSIATVLGNPAFEPGDLIKVSAGTYSGYAIDIAADVVISGGWDSTFSAQSGQTFLSGQNNSQVLSVQSGVYALLQHLNITAGRASQGAGIYNNGFLTLEDSAVFGNISTQNGAGIYQNTGALQLSNVTVSNNNARSSGGGIFVQDGSVSINNSTIHQNTATDMPATAIGGGLSNPVDRPVTISNTIIAGNVSDINPDCRGQIRSEGHNLIGYLAGCSIAAGPGDQLGIEPLDARLGNLLDNGGSSLTHMLLPGSPAIDAGDPATCTAADQRRVDRPQGAACDIGAVEGSSDQPVYPIIRTYDAEHAMVIPGTLVCDQSTPDCTGGINPHADNAHRFAIGAYGLYLDFHGRSSIDNNNMPVISTVHFQSNYDNAFWNGSQIVYGDAHEYPMADDVVAHEFTHGVTQYESNLFYYYQSGAINDSLSDVWGEYYDQTNEQGTDTPAVEWLIGEDTVSGAVGAIRSMSNPPAAPYNDPDRMSSSLYYEGDADAGGVHTNSGVNNKAVFLMVDGGDFNGKTVTALGWDKTAAIYYEANTHLLTSGADYGDLYNALYQACQNLVDGALGITAADCQEVRDATDAVEMNLQPAPNFNTDAPLCAAQQPANDLFFDDLEDGASNWTFSNGAHVRWQYDSPYGAFTHSGLHYLYADDYPVATTDAKARLVSVALPPGAFLHFAHAYELEYYSNDPNRYDGGVLEYSINGGSSWTDAGSLMNFNGYNGAIAVGYGNPLAGRSAFVGTSHGYISTRLNLSSLAGQNVTFRWRLALDDIGYRGGWWVDDVRIYTCVPPTFGDVPFDHPMHDEIEALYDAGYTAGCTASPLMYCPDTVLDRAQAAVFMLRGQRGTDYVPPPEPWDTFEDDWSLSDISWAEKWAEGMWEEGLTAGCTTSGPLMYCPRTELPRVEASVFGLRMMHGVSYMPPPATGTVFADMTDTGFYGTKWAEQAYADGLLPACGTQGGQPVFCPYDLVSRAWGAYMIVIAKDLLPEP